MSRSSNTNTSTPPADINTVDIESNNYFLYLATHELPYDDFINIALLFPDHWKDVDSPKKLQQFFRMKWNAPEAEKKDIKKEIKDLISSNLMLLNAKIPFKDTAYNTYLKCLESSKHIIHEEYREIFETLVNKTYKQSLTQKDKEEYKNILEQLTLTSKNKNDIYNKLINAKKIITASKDPNVNNLIALFKTKKSKYNFSKGSELQYKIRSSKSPEYMPNENQYKIATVCKEKKDKGANPAIDIIINNIRYTYKRGRSLGHTMSERLSYLRYTKIKEFEPNTMSESKLDAEVTKYAPSAKVAVDKIIVASKWGSEALSMPAINIFGIKKRPKSIFKGGAKSTHPWIFDALINLNKECELGLESIIHASMITGDFDLHLENFLLKFDLSNVNKPKRPKVLKAIKEFKQLQTITSSPDTTDLIYKIKEIKQLGGNVYF